MLLSPSVTAIWDRGSKRNPKPPVHAINGLCLKWVIGSRGWRESSQSWEICLRRSDKITCDVDEIEIASPAGLRFIKPLAKIGFQLIVSYLSAKRVE